jgi:hypothetical protein
VNFWEQLAKVIGSALGDLAAHAAADQRTPPHHWANQTSWPNIPELDEFMRHFLQAHQLNATFVNGRLYVTITPKTPTGFEEYATNGGRPPGWTPPRPPPAPKPRDQAADALRVMGFKKGQDKPTHEELRDRYLHLAREFHPDRNKTKTAAERMTRINQAYQWLNQYGW